MQCNTNSNSNNALEKTDIAPIKVNEVKSIMTDMKQNPTVKKTIRTQIVKNRNQMETQIPQSKPQAAVTKEDIIDMSQITQHTPQVVITQMDKTDNVPDVDDFITVRRKNRVRNQNQITGTTEVNQDINFAAEPKLKRAWIYIGNTKKQTSCEDIKTFIKNRCNETKDICVENYRAKEKHNLFVWELILLQRTLL
ncbi:hypothetical protein Zmor_003414 [Zophobas morio]|uniref:Uncharacterized protein n=1 Tax=Zophobas morio TaxID=2755281 RepID=A0AA38HLI5_9CUCU|nr:hypothetical protein Zmor_003414 [Zophobas morio]